MGGKVILPRWLLFAILFSTLPACTLVIPLDNHAPPLTDDASDSALSPDPHDASVAPDTTPPVDCGTTSCNCYHYLAPDTGSLYCPPTRPSVYECKGPAGSDRNPQGCLVEGHTTEFSRWYCCP